jgi:hypothetical protein
MIARSAIRNAKEQTRETESDQVDETRLIEKLRLIETLFAGATTGGEKIAAGRARQRIVERLKLLEKEDPPVEYRFSMSDMWSRKLFVALLRRYGINPYRYSGQRYTTVMAKVSKGFVDETLWPEFQEISETLQAYLSEITDRVVSQVIHQDSSEAAVVRQPKQLSDAADDFKVGSASPDPSGRPGAGARDDKGATPPGSRSKRKGKKRKKRKRG